MKSKIQLKSESIERAGVSKDYKKGIAEYVWNAFDAGASKVNITTTQNELGGLEAIKISDNGNGIDMESLDETFGVFLVSNKQKKPSWTSIHGSKGKGRFSFASFALQCVWDTVYASETGNKKYSITINKEEKDYFEATDGNKTLEKTGTIVTISGICGLTNEEINSNDLRKCFLNIFSWYLYLNKERKFKITINGVEIDYKEVIDEVISEKVNINLGMYQFEVNFIKWLGKISEKYYYYFLDSDMCERYKQFTSYNNNTIEFPHSVYIKSNYFDDFEVVGNTIDSEQVCFLKNQKDSLYLRLIQELKKIIENKRKKFIKLDAPKILDQFNKEGVMPKFRQSKYDIERKKDLEEVVCEIYSIQPRIFQKCNIEQKKSIIGFLNLLLDSDERSGIINIIDNITKLTPEERKSLSDILVKADFSRIIRTLKMIENRYKVIECLKKLVYDLNKFTNERNHIQKIIENNYWIFGEQYNLVTADKNFEKALRSYLYALDDSRDIELYKIENQDRLRRPDIFMCRSRYYEMPNSIESEENVIVELKEPNVILGKKIFRQIEDYMDLIMNESRFNSSLRKWKFIMVSTNVDSYIDGEYKTWSDKGRPFLVKLGEKYEIYAMTWDDVFKSFEIKHRYLLEKLEMDRAIIEEELEAKGIEISRAGVNQLTEELVAVDGF